MIRNERKRIGGITYHLLVLSISNRKEMEL